MAAITSPATINVPNTAPITFPVLSIQVREVYYLTGVIVIRLSIYIGFTITHNARNIFAHTIAIMHVCNHNSVSIEATEHGRFHDFAKLLF